MEFFNPHFPIMTLVHSLKIHLPLPRKRNRLWLNEKETLRIVNYTNMKRRKEQKSNFERAILAGVQGLSLQLLTSEDKTKGRVHTLIL